ncbi:MAG: hypothetical protein ABJ308_09745 [Halieaceae bacterium]
MMQKLMIPLFGLLLLMAALFLLLQGADDTRDEMGSSTVPSDASHSGVAQSGAAHRPALREHRVERVGAESQVQPDRLELVERERISVAGYYAENIAMAKAGSVRSQAVVSLALEKCVVFGSYNSWEDFEGSIPSLAEEKINRYYKLKWTECEPIIESGMAIGFEQNRWERHAKQSGSAVYALEDVSLEGGGETPSQLEISGAVIAAMAEAESNPLLQESVYRFLNDYFSVYETHRFTEREAYSVLYCRSRLDCSEDNVEEHLELNYSLQEAADIRQLAGEINSAIQAGDWDFIRETLITR